MTRPGQRKTGTPNRQGKRPTAQQRQGLRKRVGEAFKKQSIYGQLSPRVRLAAKMAEAAYTTPAKRPKKIESWSLRPGMSHKRFVVYVNNDNEVYLGLRGTADAQDLLTDASLAVGRLTKTKHYKNALADVDRVIKDFPAGTKIYASGHSLGSRVLRLISQSRPVIGIGFNTGSGAVSKKDNPTGQSVGEFEDHHVKGDLVSATSRLTDGKHTAYEGVNNPLTAHSLSNFLAPTK